MPRPKLVSDDQVLDATHAVMLRLGPERFTLSDVAEAVGLSRAALIQRFTDKRTPAPQNPGALDPGGARLFRAAAPRSRA